MTIIGFYFDKLMVEKTSQPKGQIKIKNDIKLKDVEKEEIPLLKEGKSEAIKVAFEFATEYEPKLGSLTLNGHLTYLTGQKEAKEMVNGWKKDKKLPPEATIKILNFIFAKATIMALNLTQEVGLPPQIQLPSLKPKTDISGYIG